MPEKPSSWPRTRTAFEVKCFLKKNICQSVDDRLSYEAELHNSLKMQMTLTLNQFQQILCPDNLITMMNSCHAFTAGSGVVGIV